MYSMILTGAFGSPSAISFSAPGFNAASMSMSRSAVGMSTADAVAARRAEIPYPPATSDLHHEIELVVALKAGGADLSPERAFACVYGYAVGVDLTRRDLQGAAKAKGQPWEAGKAFDASAPISAIRVMNAPAPEAATVLPCRQACSTLRSASG